MSLYPRSGSISICQKCEVSPESAVGALMDFFVAGLLDAPALVDAFPNFFVAACLRGIAD